MRPRRPLIAAAAALLLVSLAALAVRPWLSPAGAAPGDASCDGQVNAVDATVILQLTAGLIPSLGCPQNADTDGNGSVGPVDATLVLQFVAGLIPSLGPPATATPTRTSSQTATPSATSAPATATESATATTTGTLPPTATSTATATDTATATLAASATATFTPTRTPTPLSTVHVRNSSWFVEDELGDVAVLGEVYDGLSNNVAFVNVEATAFSATGEVLGQTDAPYGTCVSSIKRQTDTPFFAEIFNVPDGAVVDHVQVSVVPSNDSNFGYVVLPEPGYDPPVAGVLVDNIDSIREPDDTQHVSGEIVNQSTNTYDGGIVCIALYDSTGAVVRMDTAFPEDDPLGPGAPTTFDAFLDVIGIPQDQPLTTRVWFDGFYELP